MTLRVGIITTTLDSFRGGMGRYTENLLREFLLTDLDDVEIVLIHGSGTHHDFYDRFEDIQVPLISSIPQKLITGSLILPYLCTRLGLDVLHNPEQIGSPAPRPFSHQVLTVHDLSPIILPNTFGRTARAYSTMFLPTLGHFDRIIAVSESTKRDLVGRLGIYPDRIDVIYHGVRDYFRPVNEEKVIADLKGRIGMSSHDNYILYLGFLEPRKNLLSLLDAYAELRRGGLIIEKLVLAGLPLGNEMEIAGHIDSRRLRGDVLLTGFIEESDMPTLYSAAKLFVFPSLYEGFGLPILEAMSCGCPVCTSNISSLPEIAGNAALLVDPLNIEDLASGMSEALSDDALNRRMSSLGIRRASMFSWQRCATETLKAYARALG
jgi:glycosyltransferase involved in cell wall biosynthesis